MSFFLLRVMGFHGDWSFKNSEIFHAKVLEIK